jgi:hypothetical protein
VTEKADLTSKEFKALRTDVHAYGEKFNNFAEDQRIEFDSRITALKKELVTIEKEIKE